MRRASLVLLVFMHAVARSICFAGAVMVCLSMAGQPVVRYDMRPRGAIVPSPDREPITPWIVFDAQTKQYDASPGEAVAPFVFNLTNVWTNEIIITGVKASCGCTTADLPPVPWHIPPGGGGQVHAQINLAGKMGLVTKTLTFSTSTGKCIAYLKVNIPVPPSTAGTLSAADRGAAMMRAKGDPRAIFGGDCARCHVEKGRDAFGEALYAADCGICHESSHRESVVPDLHALKQATDFDYWKTVITLGKPHTMMPGFAVSQGGPLSDAQVTSLATYLNRTISHNFTTAMTNAANVPLNKEHGAF
jgi:mono/diheme cytochrome c family protein